MIQFDSLAEQVAKIKVVGVGGAGGNAINGMIDAGLTGVEFIVVNTDAQDLDKNKAVNKIQIGKSLIVKKVRRIRFSEFVRIRLVEERRTAGKRQSHQQTGKGLHRKPGSGNRKIGDGPFAHGYTPESCICRLC